MTFERVLFIIIRTRITVRNIDHPHGNNIVHPCGTKQEHQVWRIVLRRHQLLKIRFRKVI